MTTRQEVLAYCRFHHAPDLVSIRTEMAAVVSKAVHKWVEDHPEEVAKALKETIEAGIFQMMMNHFAAKTSWPLQQLSDTLRAKGVI